VPSLALGGALAGLLAGVLAGLFGVGGGIVLVPLLGLLLGLGQHAAQGVTLAVLLLPVGLPAVVAYHRRSPLRWGLVALLVVGFLAGVGVGAAGANHLAERPLQLLFVLFLLAVAGRGWWESRRAGGPRPRGSPWHGLWIGAAAGLLSGLMGIGGGILMVPLLVAFVGLEQFEAQGTSLAAMLPPVGLPGVLVYARAQELGAWSLVAAVVAGFGGGAFLGARLAARARGPELSRAFALFVLSVAAAMLWRLWRG
jgi:uncharacterized membrane protein YfcA